ncbi:MAG: VWA domain-containing protein [Nitrospirae bacterium]|nr:VWA domain-containing protein [Nitrospirota bacterium]MDA1302817.1 VWA domain-containing protein [Nitrospirota bacterium]
MNDSSLKEQLLAIFGNRLSQEAADVAVQRLVEANVAAQVLELLSELQESSAKLVGGAIEALPEVLRRCDPQTVVPWLDLTIGLASLSGAVTLKYLRESPHILGILEDPAQRQQVLSTALEVADNDSEYAANCAFEFFRKTPELLFADANIDLAGWAEVGQELTDWNQVLGIEFFRECVNVAEVLPLDEVRPWVAFGTKLITQNSLGKTDYVGILEFFRTSPSLLKDIDTIEIRPRVVSLGSTLADRSPEIALTFLAEIPRLLKALPTKEWQTLVLQYGTLLAERDADVTLAYLRRCPEVVNVTVGSDEKHDAFEQWFRGGMEVLDYSPDGARAYFALETAKALHSIEQAMNGVTLRQVARSLKLFAQMIAGASVFIESLPEGSSQVQTEKTPEGMRVRLPMVMNQYPTREMNLRSYTVMVAHEVGHLEFGTYQIDMSRLQEMARKIAARYAHEQVPPTPIHNLSELFSLFPQKGVIQDLWTILEDARVEFLLQQEYPGLRHDLAALAKASVSVRSLLHGMTAREMVLDALLLHMTQGADAVHFQDELKPVIERCWALAQSILQSSATADDVIETADQIYQVMEDMIGTYEVPTTEPPPESQDEETDIGAGPRAAEETAGAYRSITNFAYRGEMSPELVQGETDSEEGVAPSGGKSQDMQESGGAGDSSSQRSDQSGKKEFVEDQPHERGDSHPGEDRVLEEHWAVKGAGQGELPIQNGENRTFLYPEWDGMIQDYRLKWCRVIERPGSVGSPDFAQATLEKHTSSIRLLRRYFETIRPTALRRVYGYEHGEELDLDAAINRVVDRRAGGEPSDRIYSRRDKRERQVAVAFLVDMSGSTGRQIESGGRRVIDIEKEGLVLLAEALDAIGDQYALYGFSGQGRDHVDFLVLKDFEETARYKIGQRIEAMAPLQQNRDGAAIRHAAQKLLQCPARHRLLILLSDGKPLDGGYAEEYALEDTKMALREARQRGISPFCLTIDQEASGYLKRMYGDVQYLVLDDVADLPERLPRVYQRLTGRT